MKIAMASDHAGFEMKASVRGQLEAAGHEIIDFGTNATAPAVDFSDHVYPAALAVSRGDAQMGVLIDGAGYPSGIVANLLPGVFAAVCNDVVSARLAREHTNANVLCMGGKIVGALMAPEIVNTWLAAKFLGGKYAARVEKVQKLAVRHRRPAEEISTARKVVTLQDVRDALSRRQSLILDETTVITPSVLDLVR